MNRGMQILKNKKMLHAHDSEELNPEQEDEEKKASRLKKYVYLNEMISREEDSEKL